MKIVRFSNGLYGIRKGFFRKCYKDLNHNYWWSKGDKFFKDCMGTKDVVLREFNNLHVTEKVVSKEDLLS